MNLFAHITTKDGKRINQSLKDHCTQTAQYASESLKETKFYHMAYLAGILHDMGKATKKYNDYLERAFYGEDVIRGSVNHTFAGVVYLLEKFHTQDHSSMERLTAEVISFAIGGHHGLFDCVDLEGKNGFVHRLNKDRKELCYEEAKLNYFKYIVSEEEVVVLFEKAVKECNDFYMDNCNNYKALKNQNEIREKVFFMISMLSRLLLSAVIYGDRRDTSEFMNHSLYPAWDCMPWESERKYFEEKIKKFTSDTYLNCVRREISDQCLEFAKEPTGIYRLNVPTGGGKTLCTLRYALAHAQRYQKKRIIFIIPLLSVLDQNAKVIRHYISDEQLIIEHHSNVVCEKEMTEELDLYETLTEVWESPIIISTLVQFLDILFAHKTSQIGRMRALCNSVIVIDEVQSVPQKTIAMFNTAINFLKLYCNTTIILSSATQPCFERLKWPVKFEKKPEMVVLSPEQLAAFERVNIIDKTDYYGMSMDECGEFCLSLVEKYCSLLVICNTKKEARDLYRVLDQCKEEEGWFICHLSTSMCQKHRMEVLKKLQIALDLVRNKRHNKNNKEKVICISTQLVEAGVDFSFQCVVRIIAGIDNLAQAAGRCNRSNEYGNKGDVYLINLKNENLSMLKEIRESQKSTQAVLANKEYLGTETLIGQIASQLYYQYLFQEKELQKRIEYPIDDYGTELFLVKLLSNQNTYVKKKGEGFLLHQPFKTVSKSFKVFDDETMDILVPYEEGEEFIAELKKMRNLEYSPFSFKEILQRIKLYTVNIYQWQKDKLWEAGLLYGTLDGRILVLDKKAYDEKIGVNMETKQDVSDYIL